MPVFARKDLGLRFCAPEWSLWVKIPGTDADPNHEGAFVMWQALAIVSFLVGLAGFIGIIVGLIVGIARKRWKALKWSAIIGGVAFVLLIVGVAGDGGFEESGNAATSTRLSASRPTATPVPSLEELKVKADTIGYRELFRNNERYESQSFYFKGEIVQLLEHGGDTYDFRVRLGDVFDDEVIYISEYKDQRLLEDDVIEFVSESTGLLTYKATFGNRITIPQLKSLSVRLVSGG